MTIKLNNIRVKNLVELMKSIRMEEDTEIFSGMFWKSPESLHEDTIVFWIDGMYPGLLIETSTGHHVFVRREMTGTSYSDQFTIEDWSGSDWVTYAFDPFDGIYGLSRNCLNMFKGGFMDACGYVLDFWMSRR